MPLRNPAASFALLLAISAFAGGGRAGDPDSPAIEFFEKEIRPLLHQHCFECHGAQPKEPKGGLRLSSRAAILRGGESGPAALPGNASGSLLLRAVRYVDSLKMPPSGPLRREEVERIAKWIELGLPWPGTEAERSSVSAPPPKQPIFPAGAGDFWAFRPPAEASPPEVNDRSWPITPIDRFILHALEERGLRPALPAAGRALYRRIAFDLTGLPPDPREVEAFAADPSPGAVERAIDRFLASPAYGERWGRHWLDVARYADCKDARDIGQPHDIVESYRYRDWVVEAFNADLPYDRFVRDQVAGDLVPSAEPGELNTEGIVATGFLTIGSWGPGDADVQKMHCDMVDDQINAVSRAFLGLTLACARCHDHKFDPLTTADYYALAGIFFSTTIAVPQISAPYNKVPLILPPEIQRRQAALVSAESKEKELEAYLDSERQKLVDALAPEAGKYLLAALDYRMQPRSEARLTPALFARARGLRGDFLSQWTEYLAPRAAARKVLVQGVRDLGGNQGVHAFKGPGPEPLVVVNSRDQAVMVPGTIPARSLAVHPGPRAGVGVGWRSPIAGTVRISGSLRDAHAACGDGVEWTMEHESSSSVVTLATGSFPNGGGQDLKEAAGREQLGAVSVERGDLLLLSILPRKEHSCDLTLVELVVAEEDGEKRVWNLAGEVVPRFIEGGNPRADGRGHRAVWHFLDLVEPRLPRRAERGPGSALAGYFSAVEAVLAGKASPGEAARAAGELDRAVGEYRRAADPGQRALARFAADLTASDGPFRIPGQVDEALLPAAVLAEKQRRLAEIESLRRGAPPIPYAMAASEGGVKGTKYEGFHDAPIHLRGRYDRLGETVQRRMPLVLAGQQQPSISGGSGRMELAGWIASPANPLTARVMVNRIWQHHFGAGLVRTPGNFGRLGEPPTHPQLLDWLARRFMESGWSVKAMHRLIITSAVYQQSDRAEAGTLEADPENRLLGRRSAQRLEAEAIRDSLLAVSGTLDRSRGGKPTRDPQSPRRSLYQMTIRSDRSGFSFLFDAADPEDVVDERPVSTVAPQALLLLNGTFALSRIPPLAERIRSGAHTDPERMDWAHLLLFGRSPSDDERAAGLEFVERWGWEAYAQVLLSLNEFVYLE